MIMASVYDNGIGIKEDFNIDNSNSLGLKLVDTLVKQLEGTFKFYVDNGTEFVIEFNEVQKVVK
jgi:two-component sensor histidine kinase